MLAWRIITITGPGSTTSSPSRRTFRPSSRRVAAMIDPAQPCWTYQVLDSSHCRRRGPHANIQASPKTVIATASPTR